MITAFCIGSSSNSRIALWTAEQGLLKTQYLAGFKRLSSADSYRQAHLEDLKEQVAKYHPLKEYPLR